ncbi:hypothetical protein AWB92_03050 [Mycobacterium sp. IEC1808]|uniref:hypothetical protein n=1 Tax=Mycobacterium sp. IEC1808 TaxID=1743230 RepID=UPI000A165B9D|nr:hypothetical protein [Mycobacterium sp. IEC1808]ORW97653.1 hypothetical protein AWB92_03050 [Mycobacterium sp. IEC1808]
MLELQATMRPRVDAALRAAARATAPRPAAARRAAKDLQQKLGPAVAAEIRWAFTPPRNWLMGVVANVVFAAAWLLVQPLTPGRHHHDWAVLVGTYFSSWVLADVTTTNLLGADHYRVQQALSDGVPFWRVLLIKNLALLTIVGLPTLLTAMVLTLWFQTPGRLAVTIPTVAVPIVSWLGVGNFFSVLHPVSVEPLLRRWRQRGDRRRTGAWILALTLPYALYYVADPMNGVEHRLLWTKVPALIWPVFGRDTKSFVHLAIAVAVWIAGTVGALVWVRKRGVQIR